MARGSTALRQTRAVRDSVERAHSLAVRSNDLNRMVNRLNNTARQTANVYINKFGGVYDPRQTQHYLQKMAQSHLQQGLSGLQSASGASQFGVREFAKQNPDRRWEIIWRHFGSAHPRPEHVAADGTTIEAGGSFGISPGMGVPHCNCMAELRVARALELQPNAGPVRVTGETNPDYIKPLQKKVKEIATRVDNSMRRVPTRWNGTIKVDKEAHLMIRNGDAAGVMDWEGNMHLSYQTELGVIADTSADATFAAGWWQSGTKTVVHELAHSHSAFTAAEYAGQGVGLEEGAAECFARAWMVKNGDSAWSAFNSYPRFVANWERVRVAEGVTEAGRIRFYSDVLQMTRAERAALAGKYVEPLEWAAG